MIKRCSPSSQTLIVKSMTTPYATQTYTNLTDTNYWNGTLQVT